MEDEEAVFWAHHLDLHSLRVVGKLTIRWTGYIDRHLVLDAGNKILWLHWQLTRNLSGGWAIPEKFQNMCVESLPYMSR